MDLFLSAPRVLAGGPNSPALAGVSFLGGESTGKRDKTSFPVDRPPGLCQRLLICNTLRKSVDYLSTLLSYPLLKASTLVHFAVFSSEISHGTGIVAVHLDHSFLASRHQQRRPGHMVHYFTTSVSV